jgi:hypothetical protein
MKILLVCKGEYRYSFPAIADTLRSLCGSEVVAMTFTTPATRMVEKTGAFHEVHNLAAHLKKFVKEHEFEECIELLRGTTFAETLNAMVYADRIISRYPFERVAKIMAGVLRFWETLLGRVRPEAVVGEVACATEWVGYSVAHDLNIPYLIPYITPVPNRIFFARSPRGNWEAAERLYREIKERDLTPEEAKTAEEFLQAFRAKKVKHPSSAWGLRSPVHLNTRQFAERVGRIPFRIQTYMEDGYFEVGSYHGTPPWEPVWHDFIRMPRHIVYESLVFKTKVPEGRKVYFPLHVQPEYTTDVRAPFYTNQSALIENIAKSVPVGYRVAVKEHPGMKGERKLSYYRQFSKFYNVDLLSPSADGHNLILSSDVNFTVTGTTAWESILYEKPVISFGPLCYGYFDLVYQCKNFADLPDLITEAIRNFRPDRVLLLKFIWSFLATAYTFRWGDSLGHPEVVKRENLVSIARAILLEAKSSSKIQADPISVSL